MVFKPPTTPCPFAAASHPPPEICSGVSWMTKKFPDVSFYNLSTHIIIDNETNTLFARMSGELEEDFTSINMAPKDIDSL